MSASQNLTLSDRYLQVALEAENELKQYKIKQSLNTSHLETKIKLLKETLNKRSQEVKEYDGVQK